ncbi:hypothetical protein [uncultured Desulfovibrio sp.]|uniref:hypothetical protein n=1 Tax=uncultured Desulfovibrio sp. TaxID=167968 RepID=UPI0026269B67|nr:hypothetical protein [uncultured Desulfovibrio sp.]
MDAKKPPKLWRRGGRNEAGKEPFACSHSAESARESQHQSCRACSFYRAIDLPSGRVRRLCALTGIKNPATPCVHFRPAEGEMAWSALDEPRQSFVCRACAHGIVPHIRAALLGVVGCLSGHVVDGAAYPIHCRDFRARGARHAA